jgi:hypothetical protein
MISDRDWDSSKPFELGIRVARQLLGG